jgi:phage tail sheath gpL-like
MVGGIEGDRSPCDFAGCKHDTRLLLPRITLTPALTAYYTERSQSTGKPMQTLVLQDLAALHRKRVAREEKRVFKEIEYERL